MGVHQGGHPVGPSKELEKCLEIWREVFTTAQANWWLAFGGLWALVANNGVIPDGDLDFCAIGSVYTKKIQKIAQSHGYSLEKEMVTDTDRTPLYCGFSHQSLPHVCLSLWYKAVGFRWFCHDQNKDLQNGIPASGYHLKGLPEAMVDEGPYRLVEWPGIRQNVLVRVPRFPGAWLDAFYPDWPYRKQRYNIEGNQVEPDKMKSYHHGGAKVRYAIHIDSFSEFDRGISGKLAVSEEAYIRHLRMTEKK